MPRRSKLCAAVAGAALLLGMLTGAAGGASGASAAGCDPNLPFRNPSLPLASRGSRPARQADAGREDLAAAPVPACHRRAARPAQIQDRAPRRCTASRGPTTSTTTATSCMAANGTTFPQAVGLASTWDPALIKQVGTAVGDEARGYNAQNPGLWGLNLWAPVVNLLRDPRGAATRRATPRTPTLTGAIATAYGLGMEGDDPIYLQDRADAQALPRLQQRGRTADTTSSERAAAGAARVRRAAFKPAISADAATGVMASYNLVNGRPATVNPDLDTLRARPGPTSTLLNVTDAGGAEQPGRLADYYATASPRRRRGDQGRASTASPSTTPTRSRRSTAIKAALDAGPAHRRPTSTTAASHELSIRFRLGEFDPDGGPYAEHHPGGHRRRRPTGRWPATAADEAMVLLKNAGRRLPLDPRRDEEGRGGRPARRHPVHRLVRRQRCPTRSRARDGIRSGSARAPSPAPRAWTGSRSRTPRTGKYVTGGAGASRRRARRDRDDAGRHRAVRRLRLGQRHRHAAQRGQRQVRRLQLERLRQRPGAAQRLVRPAAVQAGGPAADGTYVAALRRLRVDADWAPVRTPNPYVTVDADGTLVLGAPTAAEAAQFASEVITSGDRQRGRGGQGRRRGGRRGRQHAVHQRPRGRTTATDMNLAAGQEALVEAVTRPTRTRSWCCRTATRTRSPGSRSTSRRSSGPRTPARRPGTRSPTCCSATTTRPAGSPRPGRSRPTSLPADLLELRHHHVRPDLPVRHAKPLYPFGYGLSYTSFRYGKLQPRTPGRWARGYGHGQRGRDQHRQPGGPGCRAALHAPGHSRVPQPVKKLIGFQNVWTWRRPDGRRCGSRCAQRPGVLGRHPEPVGGGVELGSRCMVGPAPRRTSGSPPRCRSRRDDPAAGPGRSTDARRELRRLPGRAARGPVEGQRHGRGRHRGGPVDRVRRLRPPVRAVAFTAQVAKGTPGTARSRSGSTTR